MAHEDDTTTARGRLPLLAALLAFTIATAIAFGRVYQGAGSSLKLVVAAAGAVLIAAAIERLPVLVSTLASAVGLVLALALLVFPETTAFGLPTGATMRAITAAFREVGGVAAETIAPVGPVPALLLAGVVAVWTASFAAHALVARAASGVLALLPAGALVGFADVVLEDGVRPAYMVLFLLAAFAMLSTLGLRAVSRWGQLIPWSRAPRWSLFSTNALRAARRAAVPAALSAVLLPWVLPGLEARAWYPIGPGGANAPISIDPIVDLRPSLTLDPARELFSVATPRPAYWRMVALDRFDGQRWFSSDPRGEGGTAVSDDGSLVPSAHPGVRGTTLPVSIEIAALSSLWLPVPYETAYLDPGLEDVRYDPVMGNLVVPDLTDGGMEYAAQGALISPQPSQIDRDFSAPGADDFYAPGNPFLELPPDLPEEIGAISRDLTAEWGTSYRKVLAIQNYLQRFTYNENAPAGHGANHLLNFLTETKTGYCEQFAGAMAVMLRTIGIPSRVVIGFTPGAFDPEDRRYHVTTRNAHAWVEVHMGDFGWLAFEPTPSRSNPTAGDYQFPVVLPGNDPPPFAPPRADPRTEGREGDQRGEQEDQGGLGPGVLPDPPEERITVTRSLLAGAALALALLAAIPLAKLTSRRRLLAAARGPAERTLAAYAIFERRLADLGFARRGSETLWEFRDRLRRELTFGEGRLERLTRLAGRAAYGGGVGQPEADEAAAMASAAASDAERAVGRARRLAAIWRVTPRSRRRSPGRTARRTEGAVAWTSAAIP